MRNAVCTNQFIDLFNVLEVFKLLLTESSMFVKRRALWDKSQKSKTYYRIKLKAHLWYQFDNKII